MVEGARLESVYTGNCIEGSNPSLSASLRSRAYRDPSVLMGFAYTVPGLLWIPWITGVGESPWTAGGPMA